MIDRKTLVRRNNPVITKIEPLSPLSIGNHEFAFTADFTGLQTFPESYEVPLGVQSTWGWHSNAPGYYTYKDLDLQALTPTAGRFITLLPRGRGEKPTIGCGRTPTACTWDGSLFVLQGKRGSGPGNGCGRDQAGTGPLGGLPA